MASALIGYGKNKRGRESDGQKEREENINK